MLTNQELFAMQLEYLQQTIHGIAVVLRQELASQPNHDEQVNRLDQVMGRYMASLKVFGEKVAEANAAMKAAAEAPQIILPPYACKATSLT
jgi:hypothetical protein